MKDFFIWIVGSVVLSPILILVLCASFFAFVLAVGYAAGIIYSVKYVPNFWQKWWVINRYYSEALDNLGNSTK